MLLESCYFPAKCGENLRCYSTVCRQLEFLRVYAQSLQPAAALKPCAGFRSVQILAGERTQIGFVVYVHFQARVAANENIGSCAVRLVTMPGKTAGAEMRWKQRRWRAQDGVRSRAIARRHDYQGWSGASHGEQFVDVACLHKRDVQRQTQ